MKIYDVNILPFNNRKVSIRACAYTIINDKLSIIDLRNSYASNLKRKYVKLRFNKINNHKTIKTDDDYLKLILE